MLEALSQRELILLRLSLHSPSPTIPLTSLRDGRSSLEEAMQHFYGLPQPEKETCLKTLQEKTSPLQRRAAVIHPEWVWRALQSFPPELHERMRPWLSQGAHPSEESSTEGWLQDRCLATFPLGPTHLTWNYISPASHPGHIAVLPLSALHKLLETMGLHGVALALRGSDLRQKWNLLHALESPLREALSALIDEVEAQKTSAVQHLRLHVQVSLLRLRRQHLSLTEIVPRLGGDLLALSFARRFDHEGRFLACRLPLSQGDTFQRALNMAVRYSQPLYLDATRQILARALECCGRAAAQNREHPQ